MDATERERLAALAEHRDDMTDRNGQPCYLRFTGASDSHEWATGKGVQNEPVEACVHCGSSRYTNEGRRGAYMHAAAEAVPALLAALAEAEAEVEAARRVAWRIAVSLKDIESIKELPEGYDIEDAWARFSSRVGIERLDAANAAAERDRYRRQVEAVRALHRSSQLGAICVECDAAWPCPTVRATEGADGDVPMSQDRGHDLRERITHDIDRAHAQAKYLLLDDGYREGYLDGLEAAERIARGES